jgi:hypothetical protein
MTTFAGTRPTPLSPGAVTAPVDIPVIANRIRQEIANKRWSHLALSGGQSDFDQILSCLGTVDRRMEVVVSPEREQSQKLARRNNLPRPSLYQSTELDFHTDPPRSHLEGGVDLLAFFCVTQDSHDGASLMIDMGHLERDLPQGDIDALCQVEVAYSTINADGVDELHFLPLLSRDPDGLVLHYMPWGVRRSADFALAQALTRFERYIRERPVISIRLAPGDSLFLDNRRMLHGRGPLVPDSQRKLLRVHLISAAAWC